MAQFSYRGRAANGGITEGIIEALDENTAAKLLVGRNVIPLEIDPLDEEIASNLGSPVRWYTPGVSLDDLTVFARQMYSLTRSGIPILRAVSGLAETTNSLRMAHALRDVVAQLERGRTFSAALNAHGHIFNQMFVSIVHVGENTGKLDDAFLQLSQYLERDQETRKQIKSATRYPIFVIAAIVIALVVMNIMVIPQFANMFRSFGAELPVLTQFLLSMSAFFVNYWPHMLVGVFAVGLGMRSWLKSGSGRMTWDTYKLKIPAVGSVIERSLLARFSRSFSMMLAAGVPLTSALTLVADAVDNAFMGKRMRDMRTNIERGESLSRVATSSGLFTPLVLQMISVGEETGRVDELLMEVSDYYEREVDYDLKSLTSKLEPILIIIVASMVLVLALGIFTPMWQMLGEVRR